LMSVLLEGALFYVMRPIVPAIDYLLEWLPTPARL
jgi:hypothetical protein